RRHAGFQEQLALDRPEAHRVVLRRYHGVPVPNPGPREGIAPPVASGCWQEAAQHVGRSSAGAERRRRQHAEQRGNSERGPASGQA
ncbi:hypothetical protein RZS08_04245, partial [Arthrospira platensis SPKY1]|nr:hypothetical protein [Arthrospira platensis SPKY1]